MAQFITVTVGTSEVFRVNVEAIGHYVRPAGETLTEILLTGGGILRVKETMAEIDDLIRDTKKNAVISPS
jgi:hypothetical protein